MDGISSSSSSGAVALILSNLNEILLATVESFKKFMYSFEVMQSIDWTTMLLIFWIIFALFVYTIGNILFIVIKKRKQLINQNTCSSDSDSNKDRVDDRFEKTSVNPTVLADQLQSRESKLAIATGPDPDCVEWVNKIINWIFSLNHNNIEPILNVWLTALNNKSKKLSIDNGFSIEFVEIVREQSFAPELSNVHVDLESNENITATSKISTPRILLLIKATRDDGSSNEESSQYEFNIERFEGMVKIVCITEELLLVVRFMERPDFKGTLRPVKAHQQKSDNRISEDAIIDAILNVISTTVVDLCLSGYQDFPKFQRNISRNNMHLEGLSHNKKVERKLFVKVVKANSLGNSKGCRDPYCIIEVDDPPQHVQTSTIKETSSPVWNEHFIFNLEEESSEILFELYDKNNNGADDFLGLGIVSVDELKTNPSQKQIITLQPRPLETDQVSGSLTVEFLFMEHKSSPMSDTSPSDICATNSGGTSMTSTPNKKSLVNGEVTLTVSSDAEEHTGNDSSLELELTEEQNRTCASESHTEYPTEYHKEYGCLSTFRNERQDKNCSENPFVKERAEKLIVPLTELINKNTNPFVNEKKIKSFDRSVSCDNIRLIMPTIPPLIGRCSIPAPELVPLRLKENLMSPDFRGNPFNSLKVYRNEMFYSMPTHSIPADLNRNDYKLPPTPLFPNQAIDNDQTYVRNMSQSKINTNPFLENSCDLLSSHSSVNSVIGIESSDSEDSSEKTIIDSEAINSHKVVVSNQKTMDVNTSDKSRKKINSNMNSESKNSAKFYKYINGSYKKRKLLDPDKSKLETTKIGDGMVMHDSINTNTFDNSNEIELSATKLKGVESKLIPNTNKSTLTIHSAQRASENGGSEGYGTGRGTPDNPSFTEGSMISSANSNKSDRTSRSRSKEPRSIIRAIRKRFSFNKNRSKSVEIRTDKGSEPTSRDSSVSSISDRARSMPGSREPSSPKDIAANSATLPRGGNGKTDSFSNLSEISGYSTRTFVHEKSTLIVEANENGALKHYIIPISLANKSKWRKRGVKLHLYNDHLFVAKHLSGSITCQVCGKLFSRRPGKQGYQCRDCDYMCHKRCHIQVDVRCTKSTISSLKLECVVDPRANRLEKNNLKEVNNKPNVES